MDEPIPHPNIEPLKYRKLRISWSVACGIICLLLIASWVRSYYFVDSVVLRVSERFGVAADAAFGLFGFSWIKLQAGNVTWRTETVTAPASDSSQKGIGAFEVQSFGDAAAILWVPCWFLVLVTIAFAALPWGKRRFSLRTLLIAMTLVAAILGAVVYAVK